jgi:hypothetical protein
VQVTPQVAINTIATRAGFIWTSSTFHHKKRLRQRLPAVQVSALADIAPAALLRARAGGALHDELLTFNAKEQP